jgi:AcrR family transcriptional regulator
MSSAARSPAPARRQQAIGHAADLLREGGPRALTSVAVAERMGVTQSAVYRHVRNMDELSTLAAEAIIAELDQSLQVITSDLNVDREHGDDVGQLCRRLVERAIAERRSFEVATRWRHVDGELGAGIRRVLDDACNIIERLLEMRWRANFGYDAPLGERDRAALRAHAHAFHDDGHAVARLAYSPTLTPLDLGDVAAIMQHRIIAGWASFVIDMNERVGLPAPRVDLAAASFGDGDRHLG